MSRARARRADAATVAELVRAGIGLTHLVIARPGASRAGDRPGSDSTVAFHRILGFRQIAQAVLLVRAGSPEAHTLGATVDGVHAISMLPLMVIDRKRRGLAAQQFFVALGLAAMEIALIGTGSKRR